MKNTDVPLNEATRYRCGWRARGSPLNICCSQVWIFGSYLATWAGEMLEKEGAYCWLAEAGELTALSVEVPPAVPARGAAPVVSPEPIRDDEVCSLKSVFSTEINEE